MSTSAAREEVGEPERSDQALDPDPRRLERDAAERVLRRAVELDDLRGHGDERISLQALIDAADELGIDASEVRRAAVEDDLGLLAGSRPRADRWLGPDRYVVARVLDGTPDDLARRVDEWMCRGRVLRRARSTRRREGAAAWVEYTRRTDPLAGAQRALHAAQGRERLAHVRRVGVVVGRLDEDRCLVGMAVDASRSRRNAAVGATATTFAGTAATAGAVALSASSPTWIAAGAVVSAAAGVGVMWSRKAWTAGVADELEALLDALESGDGPPSVLDGMTSRWLRS